MPAADQRLDYDQVAHLYDSQPYRAKEADPALKGFIQASGRTSPRALDLGCGTGNQQVANHEAHPGARLVGADLFHGMLRQAQGKTRAVSWVQCDGAVLPFAAGVFDYVSDQYSLHHVKDKRGLFAEVLRALAPGGRFVLLNVAPEGMRACAMYRYFPEALELDARDFLSNADHVRLMEEVGFVDVRLSQTVKTFTRALAGFRAEAGRRENNSHFMAVSDAAYAEGLRRMDEELAAGVGEIEDCVALLEVQASRAGARINAPLPQDVARDFEK